MRFNPAAAFDLSDAGGKEVARDRALSRDELKTLFEAMRTARGFSVENALTVKLLLLLAVRKGELIAARWDEFELDADVPVWHLPGQRTKTGQPIDIPLPTMSVDWLHELHRLALDSDWVLPARKMQSRMLPYICESTIGVAMGKVKHSLPQGLARVAAIKHQHIVGPRQTQGLDEHAALGHEFAVHAGVQGQLGARQKQREQALVRISGRAAEQTRPHRGHQQRGVGGDNPQAAPALDQAGLVGAANDKIIEREWFLRGLLLMFILHSRASGPR